MRKAARYMGVIAGLLLGICMSSRAQSKEVVIRMTNKATYQPAEIRVSKGEKIIWTNNSDQIQTITVKTENFNNKEISYYPDDAEPFSSGAIQPGESFTYTFFIPGTYEFVSLPSKEKGMEGKIIVEEQ
jgi:plastocyanin